MIDISSISDMDLLEIFYELSTHKQVASLLGIPHRTLVDHLYHNSTRYHKFYVPKKNGGCRTIMAPNQELKNIQRNLATILSRLYKPSEGVHGFVKDRSIVTNAKIHEGQPFVLNLDLKNFFPSITFQRVVDLFEGLPFQMSRDGAVILARICCEDQQLPQGSPTSPVISNLICRDLDRKFLDFTEEIESKYSRYADDITISTKLERTLPFILYFNKNNTVFLSKRVVEIIRENGFEVNYKKIRLHTCFMHQEVTGITVNQRLNVARKFIRQIRAMFHALEKFGPELAKDHFFQYYDKKKRHVPEEQPEFIIILRGKIEFIGMVRGKNDKIYMKFLEKYDLICRGLH